MTQPESWKIHVAPVGQRGGFVWMCRGHSNCYENIGEPGYRFHDGTQIHAGPRWTFVFTKRWWKRSDRTLDEAMAIARDWLSQIENAEAECRDALEVERLVREL